jgi:hypothetical protein
MASAGGTWFKKRPVTKDCFSRNNQARDSHALKIHEK